METFLPIIGLLNAKKVKIHSARVKSIVRDMEFSILFLFSLLKIIEKKLGKDNIINNILY